MFRPHNGWPISCGTAARTGLSMVLRFPCGGTVSLIGWLAAARTRGTVEKLAKLSD